MNKKFLLTIILLTLLSLLTACGDTGGTNAVVTNTGKNTDNANIGGTVPEKNTTGDLSDESLKKSPKDSIAYQFELLKKGDTDKLKECFTDRQKESITSEIVEKAKADASKYTLDDLVASVEDGEMDGKKTAKIKMKNGRTLTTLVQTDGKWLADTVWFK